jgi:MoxR-like ATPase
MSALVAVLYDNHATADQVRTALISEGFATDRVQLTSRVEPGPAGLTPSDDATTQLHDYFARVFSDESEAEEIRTFVDGVQHGNAALVVHPRGEVEVQRALSILSSAKPLQVREHDLANQTMERAASHSGETMVGKVVPEGLKQTINPRKN